MKKLLTVLLVVSVLFTFSFGSAFAGTYTANEFNVNVNTAEAQVLAAFETAYNNAVAGLTKANTEAGVVADKAAWAAAAAEAYEDVVAAVKAQTNVIKADAANQNKEVYELTGLYTSAVPTDVRALIYTYDDEAAAAQFPVTKAAELAKIATVDTSVYSSVVKEGAEKSYQTIVEDYLAKKVAAIEEIVLDTDPIDSEVKIAIDAIAAAMPGIVEIVDEDGEKTGIYELRASANAALKVETLEQEAAAAVTLEAQKAVKLSQIATAAANLYAQAVAADLTAAKMADFQEDRAAYVEMATYLVEIAKTTGDLAFGEPVSYTDIANHAELKAAYDALVKYADKYAAEKDANGALVRDLEEIEDILEAAKLDIYKNCTTANVETYKAQIREAYVSDAIDEYVRAVEIAKIEAAREKALKNYYELEQAAVNAAYDAEVAEFEAAVTNADLAKAKEKGVNLSKINTKGKVNTAITSAVTSEYNKLAAYFNYLNTGKKVADQIDPATAVAVKMSSVADYVTWYAEQGARTAAEVYALFDAAAAAMADIPTNAELTAAKKAVEAEIAALPTTITVADIAAVAAAKEAAEAYKAYGKNDIANEAALNLAVKALSDASVKEIKAAHKALPTVAKVTIADQAAVEAVAEMIKAYNTANDTDEVFEGMYADTTYSVEALLNKIQTLKAEEVVEAVNALPLNITLADKAAVEAARAAYDAYVAEYTVIDTDDEVADDARTHFAANVLKELKAAEKEIAQAMAEAAASVEELKIVASSTAKKGSITVKWTVKGDDSAVQAYEIWKSTKHSSGYKKAFTTEKMSYKNTKGLKKGTRYFYKVRAIAYDVDGNKVTSDWSNKARRIAK